jgi:dUTPase
MNLLSTFNVERLTETAIIPEFVFPLAMGYDIYSDETKIIAAGRKGFVDTGLKIAIPEGMYGSLSARISLNSIGIETHQVIYDPFSTHKCEFFSQTTPLTIYLSKPATKLRFLFFYQWIHL